MKRLTARSGLGVFWGALLLSLGGGAAVLQSLGPTAEPASMVAEEVVPSRAAEAAPGHAAEAAPGRVAESQQGPGTAPAAEPAPNAETSAATHAMLLASVPAEDPPAAPAPPPLEVPEAIPAAAGQSPPIAPPNPDMLERTRFGMVPKLGPEGRTSIRSYARAFDRDAERRPRIGLIIGNMGLFAQHSEEAIRRLPGAVTLAFSPYALRPEPLLERARARGMEVLTALPLEPSGFGQSADPGDHALLTSLPVEENLDRLEWALARIQGQVGAIGALGRLRGERFAANAELLGSIQESLTLRGLLYVDPRPGGPSPARAFGRTVDVVLDDPSETRGEVERQLQALEALARRNGSALGLAGNPVPSVVAAIQGWAAGLEARGVVMAPVTVLLRRPTDSLAPRPRTLPSAHPATVQAATDTPAQAAAGHGAAPAPAARGGH